MSSKDLQVTCPCCSARISIDVANARAVRADGTDATTPADRFESARKRVQERTRGAGDKLESALEQERGKSARLDDLFKKAQAKHEQPPDDE